MRNPLENLMRPKTITERSRRKRTRVASVAATALGVLALALATASGAQAHTVATVYAHCYGNNLPNAPYVWVPTPANVGFLYTGSSSTERIWFQVHFSVYDPRYGGWVLLKDSDWYYFDLGPGQVTTRDWHRYPDGAVAAWTPSWWAQRNGMAYRAVYDLYWYQNSVQKHLDPLWPTHIYDLGDGQPGNACLWLY
jgi:hypothetical protein